jgi:hypothetical protein
MARPPGGGRSTCESCTYIDIREWKRVVASGVGCTATTFTLLQAAAIVEADGKADDLAAWEEAMILAQAKFLLHMAAPGSRGLLQI